MIRVAGYKYCMAKINAKMDELAKWLDDVGRNTLRISCSGTGFGSCGAGLIYPVSKVNTDCREDHRERRRKVWDDVMVYSEVDCRGRQIAPTATP